MEPNKKDKRYFRFLSDKEIRNAVDYALSVKIPKVNRQRVFTAPADLTKNFRKFVGNVHRSAIREKKETIIAARILRRYLLGKEITNEEINFLKEQSIDIARILPLVAAQVVPAPVPITPILIALGKKIGVDVLPREQEIPRHMKDGSEKGHPPTQDSESHGSE